MAEAVPDLRTRLDWKVSHTPHASHPQDAHCVAASNSDADAVPAPDAHGFGQLPIPNLCRTASRSRRVWRGMGDGLGVRRRRCKREQSATALQSGLSNL